MTSQNQSYPYQFQSTLPRGERLAKKLIFKAQIMFQSTLPRGERLRPEYVTFQNQFMFQSTLPRGERLLIQRTSRLSDVRFNPRSHEGSDLVIIFTVFSFLCFNPRSHEGSDTLRRGKKISIGVSIHAPTRGATCYP